MELFSVFLEVVGVGGIKDREDLIGEIQKRGENATQRQSCAVKRSKSH